MKTLEDQLADYGGRQRELHGPITSDELVARSALVFGEGELNSAKWETSAGPGDDLAIDYLVPRDESAPRSVQKRRPGVLAAVAAMILVVVGVVVVAERDSGDVTIDPASTPSVSDPVAPPGEAESVPPPAVADSLGYRWSRVPHDEGVFGDKVPFTGGMSDATVGGPGLVAVGQGDDGAAVWTSVDGITWSRVPHDEAVLGGEANMVTVDAAGPGLVAIGQEGDRAAVWTSVDGIVWSRIPQDEAVFGGEPVSVTAGGPGLVAVGSVGSEGDRSAAVWTSVDGITWARVPHDETVFGGEGEQTISSVTVGGPGLVAVGSDGFDDGVDRGQLGSWRRDFIGHAAVWTSVEGITWSRVPHDEAVFGGEGNQWMDAVTTGGPGLVAVGGDWSSEVFGAAVWTSADGISWSRIPHDGEVFGGENYQAMNGVTSAGSGLVAVGRAWGQSGGDHSNGSDDSAASVWTSVDGITWSWTGYNESVFGSDDNASYLLSPGSVFTEYRQLMNSVTATDIGLIAVGADWSGPSHGAAVWVATPEN